ncbi:phage portal protein [Micromonospora sp. NPDC050795]|uniref:phage portal protein n=1 Tax=Micromonospora sp. NPDC050795 TaxID=3364282 RepID=UPI0037BB11D1
MSELDDEVRRLDGLRWACLERLRVYDAYYEGEQPLRYMAPALEKEVGDRITQLVINWPRLGADAYENRLDVEGFRYAGGSARDEDLWAVWQANNCDEQSQQGHLESLILGRAFVIVGAGDDEDDAPIISVESPEQVVARRDPRTRRVLSALKRWDEEPGTPSMEKWATLYLPDSTRLLVFRRGEWQVVSTDDHGMGRVPVVPLVNRPRLLRPDGVSEFHDVLPLADAANKMATDMMVSGEFHAMPRRWAVGVKAEDFVDENGNPLSTWSSIAGRLWANEDPNVKMGQFPEADLAVFHNTIRMLAQVAAQQLALPPHYMAFTGDNPTSADAIRSAETQLVKRVERKQTYLGGAWEDVMRLVLRIQTGEWDERARSLETMWRDPATPTVAQKADAIQKLTGGAPILPVEMAREDMGYTPEQRRRMAEMDDRVAARDPVLEIARSLPAGQAGAVDALAG